MLSEQDKIKFANALPELVEYAKVQGSILSKNDVEMYFQDIALTKEHYGQIYAYLTANGIRLNDAKALARDVQKYEKHTRTERDQKVETGRQSSKPSAYLQMYLMELHTIEKLNADEEQQLYENLLKGDISARDRLAESKLWRVLEIVREYADDSMVTEDLIQEGNMGLMMALSELSEMDTTIHYEQLIDDYIRQYVAFAADEQIGAKDQEQKLLAKINLLHEAVKVLAEDMGRLATIQELADYTLLSVEEIGDIINLSEGNIDVGTGEKPKRED